jgi:hypothetical protein
MLEMEPRASNILGKAVPLSYPPTPIFFSHFKPKKKYTIKNDNLTIIIFQIGE